MIDSTLKNANILIVDDQQANIDILTLLLDTKGYTNIKTTTDPHLAVSLCDEFKPDLLLLNLQMPELSGLQVMEKLKDILPSDSYFPILVLTADRTQESKQKALSGGATDFLAKPFDLVEVDLRIKNLLKERYLHLQLENQNRILDEAGEFGENLINTVREPLLLLDQELRVVKASRSFYEFFKVSSEETIGTLMYDLGNHQWDIPKLRELLETILPEKATFDNYEVEHVFSTIGKRIMLLNARQIKRAFGKEKIILLAIEDITERKRVEASLSDTNLMTNEYLDILFNHAHAPIIIWNTSFVITHMNHAFEKLCGYDWSEVKDKKIDILFPKDKVESTLEIINNTLQSDERPDIIEIDILTKTKDVKTVLWNPANIFDKEGNYIVATIAQDITQRKLTEIKLLDSEERFRSLYENSTIGLYRTTPDGKILMANKALVKLLGYPSFEKLAKRNLEKDGFEPSYQRKEFINKIENEGEVKDFESKWIRNDGSPFFVRESAQAIRDSHGAILYYDGIVEDITDRKRAEEKIREAQILLQASIESPKDMIILSIDKHYKYLYYNSVHENFVRIAYGKDIKIGMNLLDCITNDDDRIKAKINYDQALSGFSHTTISEYGDLVRYYYETRYNPIYNDKNEIIGAAAFSANITERKHTEQIVRESEKRFRAIFDQAPIAIALLDMQGHPIISNSPLSKMVGYSSDELSKMKFTEFTYPEDSDKDMSQFSALIEGKISQYSMEKRYIHKNGNLVWANLIVTILRDENGIPQEIIGMVEDITERKRGEASLRESEEKFRHSFDYAATGICIVGVDQKFQRVNKAFREMIGYEEDELKNFTFSDITHPDDLSVGSYQKQSMLDGQIDNASFEKRYIRKDKRIIWAYVSASLIRDVNNKPQFFITQIIDITERIESEEELRKLSRAVEQSPVSITITDHDGMVEYVNPKFTEVTGYYLDEVKGKNVGILNSGYHPREFYEKLWDTIFSGKDWKGEFYNRKKNGELFWENGIISPIVNENGDITHFIGIEEDITEKKKMIEELITAKDAAEKSNSLKDAFIANISHEIRTPINGILGMTGFIKEIYSPNMTGEEAEYFTAIDRSCDRIIRTTDLIMNYSQLETGTYTFIPKQMELSSICMNLVSKYNVSAKSKSLSLLFENKIGRTVISADEYSITQVISNLIENAIIYTKMGFVTVKLYQNPQNEIMLDVIDSGIGIGGEYLSHIFESFRQEQMGYSRSYEGLGLGLALVKKILDLHNATISVESKKGEGTTFTINFGKSLQNIEELTAKKNIVPKVEVTSTKIDRIVLIVEDDIINQTIMKRYINKKYNTLVADSHDSVMENLVNNKVDLILMDISLQGSKNGLEITKELKASKEYKHIPIIAETAHAFESDQIAALEAGCDDYLTKPFSRDQLLEKIEKFVKAGDNL